MSYPTLSTDPQRVTWAYLENAVKTEPVQGKVMARRRWTKTLVEYTLIYNNLFEADIVLLKAHYAGVETVDVFNWTYGGVTYSVRYGAPIDGIDLPGGWHPTTVKLRTT